MKFCFGSNKVNVLDNICIIIEDSWESFLFLFRVNKYTACLFFFYKGSLLCNDSVVKTTRKSKRNTF